MRGRIVVMTATLVLGAAAAGAAQDMTDAQPTATAVMVSTAGDSIGHVALTQTPNQGVLIDITVSGLEPGAHGFHIHGMGSCELPDFDSAGGHYAPRGDAHGVLHPEGSHAGDLLNLVVPESGHVRVHQLAAHVSLVPGVHGTLMDEDGSAFIIHANPDDYASQPSGGGGPKLACGVIR